MERSSIPEAPSRSSLQSEPRGIPPEMEPARRLSDGRAELRGYSLRLGEINRARSQGGAARSSRKAKTGCSRGSSDDKRGVDQVAGEQSAQGTRQSVARRIRQRCQAVPNLNMAIAPAFAAGLRVRPDCSGRDGIAQGEDGHGQIRSIRGPCGHGLNEPTGAATG